MDQFHNVGMSKKISNSIKYWYFTVSKTRKHFLDLYYSIIYPFICYGNILWLSAYKKQSQFHLFITKKSSWNYHPAPLFPSSY